MSSQMYYVLKVLSERLKSMFIQLFQSKDLIKRVSLALNS
jgi:hypothetical protein